MSGYDSEGIANMRSEIVSAAVVGGISEPDAVRYERGAIYFMAQFESATAKVCELQKTHKAAREEYALYMKRTNRNADELKMKMRQVKDWNTPLAEAIKLETDITNKIYENIKKLTLQPYHSVCAKVVSLPREIRDHIYGYIYRGAYANIGWPNPHGDMNMPLLRGWVHRTPGALPINTMKLWLGDVLTYELIEHWYFTSKFRFGTDISKMTAWLRDDKWSSNVLPHRFIQDVGLTLIPPKLLGTPSTPSDDRSVVDRWRDDLKLVEDALLTLRPGATVTITLRTIRTRDSAMTVAELRSMAEELQPTVQRLAEYFPAFKLRLPRTSSDVLSTSAPSSDGLLTHAEKRSVFMNGNMFTVDSLCAFYSQMIEQEAREHTA